MMTNEEAERDYCVNLLTEKRNETFMLSLFRRPKGTWVSVHSLCVGAGVSLEGFNPEWIDLTVMWLDQPVPSTATCMVIFYSPMEFWSSVALYGRVRLLSDHGLPWDEPTNPSAVDNKPVRG
jgi:hypothetical protein